MDYIYWVCLTVHFITAQSNNAFFVTFNLFLCRLWKSTSEHCIHWAAQKDALAIASFCIYLTFLIWSNLVTMSGYVIYTAYLIKTQTMYYYSGHNTHFLYLRKQKICTQDANTIRWASTQRNKIYGYFMYALDSYTSINIISRHKCVLLNPVSVSMLQLNYIYNGVIWRLQQAAAVLVWP